jgi:hypothetical protein
MWGKTSDNRGYWVDYTHHGGDIRGVGQDLEEVRYARKVVWDVATSLF